MAILAQRFPTVQASYHSGYDPNCPFCIEEISEQNELEAILDVVNSDNDLSADSEWAEKMAVEAALQADEEDREEFYRNLNCWLDAIEADRREDGPSNWHESEIRAAGWDPARLGGVA